MAQGVVSGLGSGALYAVVAVCLTMMYRLVRVLNFAQVISAVAGVYLAAVLNGAGIPFGIAAVLGVGATGLLGALLGSIAAIWFAEASTDRRSALSIAFFVGLLGVSFLAFGYHPRQFPSLLSSSLLSISGVEVSGATVLCVVAAIVIAGGVHLLLNQTLLGIQLQALSERPITAELIGIPTRRLTVAVWTVSGLLTAAVLLFVIPQQSSDQLSLGLLIVPCCAAALVGGLRSLGAAVAGGLVLGAVQGALAQSDALSQYRDLVPFLAVLLLLLYSQRNEVWDVAR